MLRSHYAALVSLSTSTRIYAQSTRVCARVRAMYSAFLKRGRFFTSLPLCVFSGARTILVFAPPSALSRSPP